MGYGDDTPPGKEHEDAAIVKQMCQQEQEDDRLRQEQAAANSKIKDGERVKAVGDFQAKEEARERGRTRFNSEDTDEHKPVEPQKKEAPKLRSAPPAHPPK